MPTRASNRAAGSETVPARETASLAVRDPTAPDASANVQVWAPIRRCAAHRDGSPAGQLAFLRLAVQGADPMPPKSTEPVIVSPSTLPA